MSNRNSSGPAPEGMGKPAGRSIVGRLLSFLGDPLLHFTLLAVVLYFVITPSSELSLDRDTIVVPQGLENDINDDYLSRLGRLPNSREYQAAIDEWLRSELLYRQGLAMGLDKKDPMVRDRIISRTEMIYQKSAAVQAPSDAQLQAYYQANIKNYQPPLRINYEQISFATPVGNSKAMAEQLLAELRAGDDPASKGQKYNHYKKRSAVAIAARIGDDFVQQLTSIPENTWQLFFTPKGWYLVRVQEKNQPETPPLERVKHLVDLDWRKQAQQSAIEDMLNQQRAKYTIAAGGGM